jgi:hypothetical protein
MPFSHFHIFQPAMPMRTIGTPLYAALKIDYPHQLVLFCHLRHARPREEVQTFPKMVCFSRF